MPNRRIQAYFPTLRSYAYPRRVGQGYISGVAATGMAKVTSPSTSTESLSHSAKTFGDSNIAWLPEMCQGQAITM
jgi:hypothetical protein